ncbi:MAG: hypothetical protein ACLTLY_07540 [Agathobacter rectalis]
MVDSVAAAKFITERNPMSYIKLESLTSRRGCHSDSVEVYIAGRVKTMNSDIMRNVDAHTPMQLQIIQVFLFNIVGGIRKKSLR